jgi:hypothetical protein
MVYLNCALQRMKFHKEDKKPKILKTTQNETNSKMESFKKDE